MLKKSVCWAGLLCSTILAGCITAPCPAGTVMDGDICKRVSGSAAQDGDDTDQGADSNRVSGVRSGGAAGSSNGAANSGAGTTPAGDWTCINVDQSCTCVSGLGASGSCTSKPPCCFTLPALMSCQCWPEEHENCKTFMNEDPNGKRVPTCPPP